MAITQPEESSTTDTPSVVTASDMDFLSGVSDHTLSDILSLDLWTNVSSPNSLHMYDHDKLNPQSCLSTGSLAEDLEFQPQLPQFEHSDNILVSSYDTSSPGTSLSTGNLMDTWTEFKPHKAIKTEPDIDYFQDMTCTGNSELTLSQLNSNYEDTNSQKSFANCISSEDLAVLETIFVKPMTTETIQSEIDNPQQTTVSISHWIQQSEASATSLSPVIKLESDTNRSCCKQDVSMHGFSPHAPPLIPVSEIQERKSTIMTNLLSSDRKTGIMNQSYPGAQTLLNLKSIDRDKFAEYLQKTKDTRKRQVATVTSGSGERINEKWEEIKHFLRDDGEAGPSLTGVKVVKPKRQRYDSGSSVWTSEFDSSDDLSLSEGEAADSDASDGSWKTSRHKSLGKSRKHSFWQYNLQSKGPKGKRLIDAVPTKDPHILAKVEDPVFDQMRFNVTLTHGGKARRGDGNDVIPNPKKLYQLGNELNRLVEQISGFCPMSEMAAHARSKSRKEKNKIASRVCRLRKKAQHEANKVTCFGMDKEHSKLMEVMGEMKRIMYTRVRGNATPHTSLYDELNHITDANLSGGVQVCGNSVDYVNKVIEKVAAGDPTGGLGKLA